MPVPETEPELRELLREIARVDAGDEAAGAAVGDVLGRYELVREIGRGGFGVVFAARDRELGREVAVKVMRKRGDAGGELVEQFQREAAAVAGLRHPHVVTVHDWGWAGGKPYLVFELLEGETLAHRLEHGTLPRLAALTLGRDVASALGCAHERGLVHGDVKPSNVWLGRDGVVKVLDFGLAHDGGGRRLLAGAGTRAYMAPEQLAAQSADARADVYALGLVLLDALVGPRALRENTVEDAHGTSQRVALVPEEARAVVARCLAERAEDCFADGERARVALDAAIGAIGGRARRRRLWASGAVVALGLLALGAGWTRAQLAGASHARTAARVGAEVGRVEAELRYAHMAELHDVSGDEARARASLDALSRLLRGAGDFERGLGEYAIGRGHLALGELGAAVLHLRAALDAGVDSEDVKKALGEALAASWERDMHELEHIGDATAREERRQKIDETLRRPALTLLAGSSSPLSLARIALLEERYGDALSLAARASAEDPWRYEADLVAADAHGHRARDAMAKGDFAAARAAVDEAAKHTTRAVAAARSDPSAHEAECALGVVAMDLEVAAEHPDAATDAAAAAACDRALTASPRRASALAQAAEQRISRAGRLRGVPAERRRALDEADAFAARRSEVDADDGARFLALRIAAYKAGVLFTAGEDVRPMITTALAAAAPLLASRSDDATRAEFAELLFQRIRAEEDHDVDPRPSCDEALGVLGGARAVTALFRHGRIETECGAWVAHHGGEGEAFFARAVTAYEAAITVEPGRTELYDELGGVHYERALAMRSVGKDPADAFRRSVELSERALKDGSHPSAEGNLGMTLTEWAVDEAAFGRDAGPLLEHAIEHLERSARAEPDSPDTFYNLALAHRTRADWLSRQKQDGAKEIEAGRAAADRAISLAPDNPALTIALGDVEREAGRQEALSGRDPRSSWKKARDIYDKLHAADANDVRRAVGAAELRALEAEWDADMGRDPAALVDEGVAMLAPIATGSDAGADLARARLLVVRARVTRDTDERRRRVQEAERALADVPRRPRVAEELDKARAALDHLAAR